jgi:hypothetical protein
MLKSIFRILRRIALILLIAGAVVSLAYGLSRTVNISPRFGRDGGGERFAQSAPAGANGQPAQPPQQFRGGGDEGFRENGSLSRGLFQVFTNALLIGLFTWIGLLLFRRYKRRIPATN